MPVVRNPQFYFREGLCWIEIKTHYIRCRIKEKSVNSNKSMAFYSLESGLPIPYIVLLLNSDYIADYVNNFINNTQTFGIDDARQIVVVIPNKEWIQSSHNLVKEAIIARKEKDNNKLTFIQERTNSFVCSLYFNQ